MSSWFKRIFIFLLTNIAVIAVLSVVMSVFQVKPYLSSQGINYESLLIFAAVIGFSGAFISLLLSKWMAKTLYNLKIIDRPSNDTEAWLVSTIQQLASQAKINMPEVGIYDSPEPNAFATGPRRNNALVAVSTGLIRVMDKRELTGVIAHEISHIANGDMVTMTLIQGVVNTFVIFMARVAAFFVTNFLSRGSSDEERDAGSMGTFTYYLVAIVFEIIFGILASIIVMAFSRWREFRADKGSAELTSPETMIASLRRLQRYTDTPEDDRAPALSAFKINRRSSSSLMRLFASHPPIEERITALEKPNYRQ